MAESVPVIQVLSRKNYEDQHLVPLPKALPLPPLASSSLRIKTIILSLTTNNLTYARVGHLLGWWDVHPLPPSIPLEYSDPKEFGRISAWGYGIVIESNAFNTDGSPIEVGTTLYGYLPIGTLPVDMEIKIDTSTKGQFLEVSKQRENLMPIYNRYKLYSSNLNPKTSNEVKENFAWRSMFGVLFQTGYMMNRYTLAWETKELVHPSNPDDGWTFQHGHIDDNTTLLLFSASGKTALGLAHQLKYARPSTSKPREVIGIVSEASRAFVEATDLYDRTLLYTDDKQDLGKLLDLKDNSKIITFEFGSRGGAEDRWAATLRKTYNVVSLGVGGEVIPASPEQITAKFLERQALVGLKTQFNASAVRSQAFEIAGVEKYEEDFQEQWDLCKKSGYVKGLRLVWGEGMDDIGKGWERLCKGEVGPDEGLVYELN